MKRELTRTIGTLNNELLEEIEGSMDGIFGTDGEWREVGVFDSLTRTVGRVANCVFVGKELCARCLPYKVSWTPALINRRLQHGLCHGRYALRARHLCQQLHPPPLPQVHEAVCLNFAQLNMTYIYTLNH